MHVGSPDPITRLVPGRSCGPCDVCCVALTIEDPELVKLQGHRCPHLSPGPGCGIYQARPLTCRTFFCGWRRLKWVRETLRPDLSGVLVRLEEDPSAGARRLGVVVSLLTEAALAAEGLAETVAAAVAAGVPVHLHVPGPPGHTAGMARVNEALREAVRARDKPAVLRLLREAWNSGRAVEHRPVVLDPQPPRLHRP
jgi:hypothetical protein